MLMLALRSDNRIQVSMGRAGMVGNDVLAQAARATGLIRVDTVSVAQHTSAS